MMTATLDKIPRHKLFVQVTYDDLIDKLWLILFFKVNFELYVKPNLIGSYDEKRLENIRSALDRNKILRRFHAPIYDPYESGFEIISWSYIQSLKFCKALGAGAIVMHAEYESKRSGTVDRWLDSCKYIWKEIADSAEKENMIVLVENHNESSAEAVVRLIDFVRSPNFKACFDIGHYNVFGDKELEPYLDDYRQGSIGEIHLSDNLGDKDSHLPLGEGNIDFVKLFKAFDTKVIGPAYTIESKDLWGVIKGSVYLKRIGRL